MRDTLNKICFVAIRWGWPQVNPARGTRLPPIERRRAARILTAEETATLVPALPQPSRTIIALGVTTGLRIGGLLGLKVSDLDLPGQRLWVCRAVYRGDVRSPKTKARERQGPLASLVTKVLKTYLQTRRSGSDWPFPSDARTPLNDRNLMRCQVEPTCDVLKIPRFGWHILRHAFSTIAGNSGVPLPLVQSLLGHTSLDTTMLYAHPVEASKRKAVERVSRVLCPNQGVLCPNVPKSEPVIAGGSKLVQRKQKANLGRGARI
jgi:integrase